VSKAEPLPTAVETRELTKAYGELVALAPLSLTVQAGERVVLVLPDDPVLYDDLSLAEHVEFVARLHDAEGWEDRSAYLIDRLELTSRLDDLPARFSRGLRQKTSLVLGLVRPFEVLVVDEPFVGLDQSGKAAILELLDDAADSGATVVVATHQMDFVDRATRCLALRDGELTHDGPADQATITKLLS